MDKLLRSVFRLGFVAGTAGVVDTFFLYNVDGGYRGVVFDRFRGILPKTLTEGTSFVVPWLQNVTLFDVRDRPKVISTVTGTKDLQQVNISLRVLFRPIGEKLSDILSLVGPDYDERVLPGIGNEVLKAVVAQYKADELLLKREDISKRIADGLRERAGKFHLVLDDVSITHLTFSREYTKAIESKQVAEQEAERQTYVVQKAEQEKKANVIRAQGESSAAKLISDAMASNGSALIELRRIEAAKDIAETLAKNKGITYLPSGGSGNGKDGNSLLLGINP